MKGRAEGLWALAVLSVTTAVILSYHSWQHWIAYATGSYNTPGTAHNYNFFSGFGSDLAEYTLVVTLAGHVLVLWKTHTCHYTWWCWRSPKFRLGDTPHMLCGTHHPDEQVSAKQAVAQYQKERTG